MNRTWLLGAALAMGVVIGCVGPNGIQSTGNTGGTGTGGNGGTGGTVTGPAGEGLPCDVASVLNSKCVSCHGNPKAGGAPFSLLTYAEVSAQADASLAAMKGNTMPPGGGASAADIAAFQSWIDAGKPQGTCGGSDAGVDTTFSGPSTCTSGNIQPVTYQESSNMNPGRACVKCHNSGEGPGWWIGGTVFDTGHVPDGCQPTAAQSADLTQAKVIITINGTDYTASVRQSGNFFPNTYIPKGTYTARVEYQGKTRAMATPQTDGDCNTCHTDAGANGAPGRIALPQ